MSKVNWPHRRLVAFRGCEWIRPILIPSTTWFLQPQTASRSVHPFLRSTPVRPTHRQTIYADHATCGICSNRTSAQLIHCCSGLQAIEQDYTDVRCRPCRAWSSCQVRLVIYRYACRVVIQLLVTDFEVASSLLSIRLPRQTKDSTISTFSPATVRCHWL